jgi:glucose/arabinose dehydrogenase
VAVAVAAWPLIAQQPDSHQPAGARKQRLPEPFATPSTTKFSKVIGWPEGKTPQAPAGFRVNALVQPIENPRWIYVLPNGDILVAQSRTLPNRRSPNRTRRSRRSRPR